mgnify:CR=1 FL=1
MKRFLLCTATVLAMFGSISQADAKDPEDQEFRHVVVTLKSGEKVEGYLHRGWHAEGALLKQENYSFKITKTPDDKEPVKYTADDVVSNIQRRRRKIRTAFAGRPSILLLQDSRIVTALITDWFV